MAQPGLSSFAFVRLLVKVRRVEGGEGRSWKGRR